MQKAYIPCKGIQYTVSWSVEYDGRSVLELLAEKPKMSYKEIIQVVHNEGGFIDDKAIIHKGSANEVLFSLD